MKRTAEAKITSVFPTAIPIRLHLRTDLHLARKLWHMGMGLVGIAIYMSGLSRSGAIIATSSLLGMSLLVETARLRMPSLNEKVIRFWGPIMRTNEANRFSGTPYYLAALVLSVAIFPKPITVLSVAYLACGDPIASLAGILFGKYGPRFSSGKSLIGTAAGVLTCMIVSVICLSALGIGGSDMILLSLIGGLAGGTAELLPLEVDDNFSIPIVSGFVLWLAFMVLGI